MIKSKVIRIFCSFNSTEKAALRKWVNSPIHNQHGDVKKLIDLLLSKRKITPTSVKRERIFNSLYPHQDYNLYRLNHVLSFCVEIMEEFISYSVSKKKKTKESFYLYQYYLQRNMPDLAQKALEKAQKELRTNLIHNEIFYHTSFLIEQAKFDLAGTEQRQQQTNLQDIFKNLATFTIIATLRNACTAISHKNLFHTEYKIPLLAAILAEAASDDYKDNLVVRSYYHSYMALTEPKIEKHFKALKNILLEKQVPLPNDELKYVSLLAINYCIKRLNTGAEIYVQEVFDIYCFGLKQQIWLENGFLSHNTFKNIATAALRLKAYKWVHQFIQTYSPKIKVSHQKAYTNYIKAKLLFEQEKYNAAQSLLLDTESIDLFIGLAIKLLLLKIYWKLDEVNLLEAHLDSFSVYLNRKKILAYHRQIYGNIISITRKLVNTNLTDAKEQQQLKQVMLKTKPLTELPWFLKQLE